MASDKLNNRKFTLGDFVFVKASAPEKYRAIEAGDICGVFAIETDKLAEKWGEPIGCSMYIVEAGCGDDLEIPEQYLEFETD